MKIVLSNRSPKPYPRLRPGIPGRDTSEADDMATAREKQDSAFAAYQLAKDREQTLAGERGQSNPDIPLVVDDDDDEFRSAIETEVSAQVALSTALRAVDD